MSVVVKRTFVLFLVFALTLSGVESGRKRKQARLRIFNDTDKILGIFVGYSKVHDVGTRIGAALGGTALIAAAIAASAAATLATAGLATGAAVGATGIAAGAAIPLVQKSFHKTENGFTFAASSGEVYKGDTYKDIHNMGIVILETKREKIEKGDEYYIDHFEIRDKRGKKVIDKNNKKIDIKKYYGKITDVHIELSKKGEFKIWATEPYKPKNKVYYYE